MDNFANVIFLLLMIYETVLCFTKKYKGIQKLYGSYPDDVITKYANLQGIASLFAVALFAILCLDDLGITNTGLYPLGHTTKSWIMFAVCLGLMILIMAYAYFIVLKPNQNGSASKQSGTGKKAKKKEEDDF